MSSAFIEGFPDYTITPDGVIVNTKTGMVLKGWRNGKDSYWMYSLRGPDRRRKHVYAHRLLAEAFIPNPQRLREVNHKDGNKLNNALSNLEWVSSSENIRHAFSSGLSSRKPALDYTRIPELLARVLQGETLHDLTKETGCKESSTLRKLLLREAQRQGLESAFLAGVRKAQQSQVAARSHGILQHSVEGWEIGRYPSINAAARAMRCNPATIWRAIRYGRPYKDSYWSRYDASM